MATGKRDLERSPRLHLAADLCQVGDRGLIVLPGRRPVVDRTAGELDAGRHRRRPRPSAGRSQHLEGLAERGGADRLHAVDETRLGEAIQRHHDASHAASRERHDHRQDARHRPDVATQRQFADERPAARRPELLRTDEDRGRDRQVERGPSLAQIRRGQIDGDPTRWVDEPAVPDGSADAFSRLLERGVRETDDRGPGQPGSDVHLDADDASLEPMEGGRMDRRKHGPKARTAGSPATYQAPSRRLVRWRLVRSAARRHDESAAFGRLLVDRPSEVEERPAER
ncbi:MAG: hypothetical protein IVW53_01265 [Chloroflexi bacterium]|nr:hypothetical protein [Chloroflexota bacterium]